MKQKLIVLRVRPVSVESYFVLSFYCQVEREYPIFSVEV